MSEYSGISISNEGPRDWHNLFAIPRFRYIEVLISFHLFYYYWGSKIVRYTEDFVLWRFAISRFNWIKEGTESIIA